MYVVSMDIPAILKNERREPPSLWQIPSRAAPAMQGKAVYHVYCERCHGPERKGAPPAIPSLVDAPSIFGAKTIKSVVNYGLNDMPGFPDLTDHLLDNLLLYLGNPASAPEPIPSRNEPPPATAGAGSEPVRYWSGYGLQPSIIRPPWTVMTAYDLNRGVIKWQVPLGNAPQGASENLKDTGIMMSRNGPVVTATGLIFIATKDEGKLRAYDEEKRQGALGNGSSCGFRRCPGGLRGRWARVHRSLCRLGEADGHTKRRARGATCAAGAQVLHRIRIA